MYHEILIAVKWWKEHFIPEQQNITQTQQSPSISSKKTNNETRNWRDAGSSSNGFNTTSTTESTTTTTESLMTLFELEFIKELTQRYQGHWYENDPLRGSAYRSLTYDHRLDSLFVKIALKLGITQLQMEQALSSARFSVMFINPGQVKLANLALTNTPPISLYQAENIPSSVTTNTSPSSTSTSPSSTLAATSILMTPNYRVSTANNASKPWSPFSTMQHKSFLTSPIKDLHEEKTNPNDDEKRFMNNSKNNYYSQSHTHNNNNNNDMNTNLTSNSTTNSLRWANAVGSHAASNGNMGNRLANQGNKAPFLTTLSPTAPLSPASPANVPMNNHQGFEGMSANVLAFS
jgi:hypothetical protein